MDSRWSKIEVGKGKPPIELAKEDDVTFVQGIEYKLGFKYGLYYI